MLQITHLLLSMLPKFAFKNLNPAFFCNTFCIGHCMLQIPQNRRNFSTLALTRSFAVNIHSRDNGPQRVRPISALMIMHFKGRE